jgi:hypothetical protein
MGRELGINPLLVLFAVLLGGKIYGVAGILFAIPAAAVIATIVGKGINRYLLPAYERPGWWRASEVLAYDTTTRSDLHERPDAAVPRASVPPREPSPAQLGESS